MNISLECVMIRRLTPYDIVCRVYIIQSLIFGCRSPYWQQEGGMRYRYLRFFYFRHGKCSRQLHMQVVGRKRTRQLAQRKPRGHNPRGFRFGWDTYLHFFSPTVILPHRKKHCQGLGALKKVPKADFFGFFRLLFWGGCRGRLLGSFAAMKS